MSDDGTYIPHYLGEETRGEVRPNSNLNSIALRVGEVKAIVYPKDKVSISDKHKWVEYTVEVVQQNGRSTVSSTLYHGCVVGRLFGGIADRMHYTLRPDTKKGGSKPGGIGVGSKVLLLCINGNRTNPVIISGLPDDDKGQADDKQDGHNLLFEFNGINATVNNDGELTVMFRGATDVNGDIPNTNDAKEASGAKLIMNKDGGIKLHSKDESQFIFIDNKNKKINILADDEWNVKVNTKLVFNTGSNTEMHTDADMKLDATGNVKITSAGTLIGQATDSMLLASTYRQAEQSLHTDLLAGLSNLSIQFGILAGALTAGAILNPPLAAGAAAATAAVAAVTKMAAAIGQFEAGAVTYLSLKNKND